ncbi:MAG: hypothetical protein Q4C46_05460 [Bacillota bacterium]|nr:hypothetical protein [Bacillota bacterium]
MIPMNILIKYQMGFEGETPEDVKERYGLDFWRVFLLQTDHIPNKIMEAQALGETPEDYTEILNYRQFARDEINRLSK